MKDDIYIILLKEAGKELNESAHRVTLDQFKARVNRYKLQIDKLRLFSDIYNNGILATQDGHITCVTMAYMKLYEYEDLQQARQDSKGARIWSIVATFLAVVAIALQIIYGQCQGG